MSMSMKDIVVSDFQTDVDERLSRHRSVLDLMTKYQDTTARVNRTLAKAATQCGCVELHAIKQSVPEDITLEQWHEYTSSHLNGKLCPSCRDAIQKDIGANLFYLAALCNALGLSMYDSILEEQKRMDILGNFHLR